MARQSMSETAYGRFPDGYLPGWFFPDETFPGKTS